MKNKTTLVYMEQIIMVLVFALAAVVCVQAFTLANGISVSNERRSRALLAAQNAAETLSVTRGDCARAAQILGGEAEEDSWTIGYDKNWQIVTAQDATYTLTAKNAETDAGLLGTGEVTVCDDTGAVLASLPTAWQEVREDG